MIPSLVEVLLAEDDPADAELILKCLDECLGRSGDRVHVVRDGEWALDFLFARGVYQGRPPEARPRLVLLDLKLPKVDGAEVLARMKGDPTLRAIPVVVLSSSNVERDVARCYRLGANSYVQKPVDFVRFREVVRQLGRYWLEANEPPPPGAFPARHP